MADDSLDLGSTFQNLSNLVTTGQANAAQMAAYQAVIDNLKKQFGNYDALQTPDYKNLTPEKLGPSALGNIQNDAQSRLDQQNAEAQLQDIANRGGLDLGDRAALNNLEQTLSRNNSARQNSLANQYAARGQLGSGAQLSMDLANQQNAAQNANQHGEDIAAQAQKRAVQAIIDKAGIARSMSSDQYARDKAAAEAADSIARYNASMGTDAQKYNNTIAGQGYDDKVKKLQGEMGLTGQLNTALLGQGNQKAAGIVGQGNIIGNGIIPGLSRLAGGKGNVGGTTSTENGNTSTYTNKDGSSTTGTVTDNAGSPDTPDAPGTQNTQDFGANLQPDESDATWTTLVDDSGDIA